MPQMARVGAIFAFEPIQSECFPPIEMRVPPLRRCAAPVGMTAEELECSSRSVLVGEIHSVGVLLARDLGGVVLDFEVGLEDLDVQDLALGGVATVGADAVEGEIAVMRF